MESSEHACAFFVLFANEYGFRAHFFMLIIEPFAGLFASGFSAISFLDEQLTCSFAVCTLMCRSAHMASRVLSAQLPPGVILILI